MFTLVELLVVIAIISVLAAILLPTLAKSKVRAMRIGCLSNQKQLVLATQSYTDENEDYYPLYTKEPALLQPYVGGKSGGEGTVFYCPAAVGKPTVSWDSDSDRDLGGPFYTNRANTYGWNCHLRGAQEWGSNLYPYWWVAGPVMRVNALSDPSRVMWVLDATSSRVDVYYTPAFIPAFRHGGSGPELCSTQEKRLGAGFNIGFTDGHAAWAPWSEWLDFRLDTLTTRKGMDKQPYPWVWR